MRKSNSICTGLACIVSLGVFLKAYSASHRSLCDWYARLRSLLTVLIAFSVFPFDCGYPGEEVV